jgi:ketosteroid isomerase-like protein
MTERQWTAAMLARDWDTALAMCAPNVVYMPADHPVLHGHAALRGWFEQFPPILKFTQPLETVEAQGNLAIGRATFTATIELGGKPMENTGKVLAVWQKGTSGQWLVAAVCWNWDWPFGGAA